MVCMLEEEVTGSTARSSEVRWQPRCESAVRKSVCAATSEVAGESGSCRLSQQVRNDDYTTWKWKQESKSRYNVSRMSDEKKKAVAARGGERLSRNAIAGAGSRCANRDRTV